LQQLSISLFSYFLLPFWYEFKTDYFEVTRSVLATTLSTFRVKVADQNILLYIPLSAPSILAHQIKTH